MNARSSARSVLALAVALLISGCASSRPEAPLFPADARQSAPLVARAAEARLDFDELQRATFRGDEAWNAPTLQGALRERLGDDYEKVASSMKLVHAVEATSEAVTFVGCVRGECRDVAGYVRVERDGAVWAGYLIEDAHGRRARVVAPRGGSPETPASLDAWLAEHDDYPRLSGAVCTTCDVGPFMNAEL